MSSEVADQFELVLFFQLLFANDTISEGFDGRPIANRGDKFSSERYENTAKVVLGELLSSQLLEPEAWSESVRQHGSVL